MFRISGSDFVRSLALTVAVVTLSFAAVGCSSSNSDNTDAGSNTMCTQQSQVDAIFNKYSCTVCHDATGSYAGLNLTSTGLVGRLVGVAPPGGGSTFPSVCANMNQVYLVKNSNPATGLLLDKITQAKPTCGAQMPYMATPMSASDIACVQSWANTVTSM